jgi:hypothetical protein
MKYAFKYLDLDMDAFKLSDHVLQSLTKDDFEVEESKEKEYN